MKFYLRKGEKVPLRRFFYRRIYGYFKAASDRSGHCGIFSYNKHCRLCGGIFRQKESRKRQAAHSRADAVLYFADRRLGRNAYRHEKVSAQDKTEAFYGGNSAHDRLSACSCGGGLRFSAFWINFCSFFAFVNAILIIWWKLRHFACKYSKNMLKFYHKS